MKKKVIQTSVSVVVLGIGCYISYMVGYDAGRTHGWYSGYAEGKTINAPASSVKHHYEFKQRGVSIFRFDLDTGESCWLQLSKEDAQEEDHLTNPMQQCPQ
jgi:hypothetical protein